MWYLRRSFEAPENWQEPSNSDMEHKLREGRRIYRESKADLDLLDQNFTRQIQVLFSMLESLDNFRAKSIHLNIIMPTLPADASLWGIQRSFVSWRVHLLWQDSLPSVTCVRKLTIKRPHTTPAWGEECPSLRKIDTRVLLDLAKRFPNLVGLSCMLGGDEWHSNYRFGGYYDTLPDIYRFITHDWIRPRRDSRVDFGKAFSANALQPNLRHVHLDFLYPLQEVEDIDQRWGLPNLVAPSRHDLFSTSLRLLSYYLRTMNLRAIADATLFWPDDSSTAPAWPCLEAFHVVFHMAIPSGLWYFHEHPDVQGPLLATDISIRHTAGRSDYPPLADTVEDGVFHAESVDMKFHWNAFGL
ncbi:hypothetical protein BU23DRAFT_626247 [Bimuria novae-zelandiae CBS 107.79]|uniref:Uncharacterized protein n=1 Tax=Bimuria novae-zelandiae CBS 107.79 TaxID=1447943 RepID=A0A6A5VHW8_9PLEO|nr:hypothetical protein BU23DRAFT_626247 [Bimuria novae-zelandiae CBS 107.79]